MVKRLMLVAAMSARIFWGQGDLFAQTSRVPLTQDACEAGILQNLQAKEIVMGPDYQVLQEVASAFELHDVPRLYVFDGSFGIYYIVGSAPHDGKGKVLISRTLALGMRDSPALKGAIAHEMAHLVEDVKHPTNCNDYVYSQFEKEAAADALAASKVGFAPLKSFLTRAMELVGVNPAYITDDSRRLKALEELEAKQKAPIKIGAFSNLVRPENSYQTL
jgi:hypothetical protein